MSTFKSLKNVIPKRKYRERSQPEWRKNRGLLEKKQDYLKRSKKYHQKTREMNNLRLKAALKNPEEFYHKMINSRIENGHLVKYDKFDPNFDEKEYRKILKTKNQGMVKYQKYRLMKKLERMKPNLQLVNESKGKVIHIVGCKEEAIQLEKQLKDKEKLNDSGLGKRHNPEEEDDLDEEELMLALQMKKRRYRDFALTLLKHKEMEDYYIRIDQEKALLQDGRRKTRKTKNGKEYTKMFRQRKK